MSFHALLHLPTSIAFEPDGLAWNLSIIQIFIMNEWVGQPRSQIWLQMSVWWTKILNTQ